MLGRIEDGSITVVENGSARWYGSKSGPTVTVSLNDCGFWSRVLTSGSVGLGATYTEGMWETDDLVGLITLLARNRRKLDRVLGPLAAASRLLAPLARHRAPSADEDRRNISAHYDLGNEFFRLFLDPTLTYSCAYFADPQATLEEAQTAKLDRICQKLRLSPDDQVLEIGTGWGSFAVHAASRYGCRVTTTTISQKQFSFATERVRDAGLEGSVKVLDQHYRDLRGQYSKLVSIEMIEAVDWRLQEEFLQVCERLLAPDGLAAIQAIVIDDRNYEAARNREDFIKHFIFPGGCLLSVTRMLEVVSKATSLRLANLEDIGDFYPPTLRRWRQALDARADEARALGFDEQFLRMWRFYFAYCEGTFLEHATSDVQVVFAGPKRRG